MTPEEKADQMLALATERGIEISCDTLRDHGATEAEVDAMLPQLRETFTAWCAEQRPALVGWLARGGETLQ